VSDIDPCAVLGIAPDASPDEARAARRRLAKVCHPDLHASEPPAARAEAAAQMTLLNEALAVFEIERRRGPVVRAAAPPSPPSPEPAESGPGPAHRCSAAATGPADPDSFSVDCLPAEAFEALFVVAYGLGDILVTDEPYLLELYLNEPGPCFCRLSLVPEAGASLVTIEVSPATESNSGEVPGCVSTPEPAAVIAVLVAELNALGAGHRGARGASSDGLG
jgi:hypothetical protein